MHLFLQQLNFKSFLKSVRLIIEINLINMFIKSHINHIKLTH